MTPERKQVQQDDFKELISRIGRGIDTKTVFGEVQVLEGRAIIPVASVSFGGGGGAGSGEGGPADAHKGGAGKEGAAGAKGGPDAMGEGSGMGMGFGVYAKPLGVIEVTAQEVRWVPIVDVSKLAIAAAMGLMAMGLMCAMGGHGGKGKCGCRKS